MHHRWANRRKVAFAELVNEAWLFPRADSWNYICMAEAFRARGLEMPKISLWSNVTSLRNHMMASGQFVTAVSKSIAEWNGMTLLPVDLPVQPWPVVIATLKGRTPSPVVELFIQFVRDFTEPMRAGENSSPAVRPGHR
jgi:DNA-binding transcriptional LysR family regulator